MVNGIKRLHRARLDYNVFDINGDTLFNNDDAIVQPGTQTSIPVSGVKADIGLIASPAVLNAGSTEYKYLTGTSGGVQKINENPGKQQFGRQSWRQLR